VKFGPSLSWSSEIDLSRTSPSDLKCGNQTGAIDSWKSQQVGRTNFVTVLSLINESDSAFLLFVRQFTDYNHIPLDLVDYTTIPKVPELQAINVLRPRLINQVHYIQQSSVFVLLKWMISCPYRCGVPGFWPETLQVHGGISHNQSHRPVQAKSAFGPNEVLSMIPSSVRHVDTSDRPQFSVSEECVIGLNESRAVLSRMEGSTIFSWHSSSTPKGS
jgi:hypothetical protein